MGEFLAWMEASALGHAMRESGVWTYPLVNLLHLLGVSSLFGSILVLDLRLIGLWRRAPLESVAATVTPVATGGFLLAVVSGAGLLASTATDYQGNPFLLIKFVAILFGVINVAMIGRSSSWRMLGVRDLSRREQRRLSVMGGVSLACWLTAVTAGRLIAYW